MTEPRNNTSPSPSNLDEAASAQAKLDLEAWVKVHKPVLDLLLDAYCVVDVANKVVDFNVAFTELCGESYRKTLKIGSFCELLKTELCPHQCPAIQLFTSQKSLRLDELRASSKAHANLQLIVSGVAIQSAKGDLIGAVLTIRNVSAEMELQKKYGERKEESVTDGLTRLFNKVYTEGLLLKTVKSGLRETYPVSVAMVDIDHFKRVNDTYGHQAGDYVLSLVAQLLKGESRDTDVVGRFGGEEFIVLLPHTALDGTKTFTERFRKRVEATQIIFEGKQIPVTVSVGTATLHQAWQNGMNPDNIAKELVHQADSALYYSKANGRNQVCQYELISKPIIKPVKK